MSATNSQIAHLLIENRTVTWLEALIAKGSGPMVEI
jgi:hypothetical protein